MSYKSWLEYCCVYWCVYCGMMELDQVEWRLHMTIGLQTDRRTDRKNQTCLILAIRQTTSAMCKRTCDRYDDRFANLCKYLAAHWLTVGLSMELTSRVDIASVSKSKRCYAISFDYVLGCVLHTNKCSSAENTAAARQWKLLVRPFDGKLDNSSLLCGYCSRVL